MGSFRNGLDDLAFVIALPNGGSLRLVGGFVNQGNRRANLNFITLLSLKTYDSSGFGQALLSDLVGLKVINGLIDLDIGTFLHLP